MYWQLRFFLIGHLACTIRGYLGLPTCPATNCPQGTANFGVPKLPSPPGVLEPPCARTTARFRGTVPTLLFSPQNWVLSGCSGCRTAIQVRRTTFHVYCMAMHILRSQNPSLSRSLKPAPKPKAAANPGPKGQHRQALRMVYHRNKGFTSEPVDHWIIPCSLEGALQPS